MSDIDVPAGQADGLNNVSEAPELADRLRVHALAKLISATSRQVLDVLASMGSAARGPQSSVDRETAQRVIEALAPGADATPSVGGEPAASAEPPAARPATLALSDPATDSSGVETLPEGPGGALPLFAAPSPMFLPPEPASPIP
ncbi:MAG: translation initiation factor IF-2 N-terminal domain-containing protein, partial [Pseudonocardia sp.]|nr:translation initiation factor IF-2 N-terminal domain-containing protein [Pseudonocardia sp.]